MNIPACVMPFIKPYADAISQRRDAQGPKPSNPFEQQKQRPQQARANEFSPAVDVFNQESSYTVHVILPGAKKQDIGTEWDATTSSLRVSGVVHRPGDEALLTSLAHDESLVGYFVRVITLGSKDKVRVVEEGIRAKLETGILRITVPKDLSERVKKGPKKVVIESNSPVVSDHEVEEKDEEDEEEQEHLAEKGDEEMEAVKDVDTTAVATPAATTTLTEVTTDKGKGKDVEARAEEEQTEAQAEEQLPKYEPKQARPSFQSSVQERSDEEEEEDWEDAKRVAID